jgi:hypothetical protein
MVEIEELQYWTLTQSFSIAFVCGECAGILYIDFDLKTNTIIYELKTWLVLQPVRTPPPPWNLLWQVVVVNCFQP